VIAPADLIPHREVCINLLWQARAAGGWRRKFLGLYGQVLDTEDLDELRALWAEIRVWQRRIAARRKP